MDGDRFTGVVGFESDVDEGGGSCCDGEEVFVSVAVLDVSADLSIWVLLSWDRWAPEFISTSGTLPGSVVWETVERFAVHGRR